MIEEESVRSVSEKGWRSHYTVHVLIMSECLTKSTTAMADTSESIHPAYETTSCQNSMCMTDTKMNVSQVFEGLHVQRENLGLCAVTIFRSTSIDQCGEIYPRAEGSTTPNRYLCYWLSWYLQCYGWFVRRGNWRGGRGRSRHSVNVARKPGCVWFIWVATVWSYAA